MMKKRLRDLACILFIIVLFWAFFLKDPPRDLGDMGMSLFSNDEVLLKAHLIDKKPFIDVISQYGDITKGGLALAYYQNNFAYPLGAAFLHGIAVAFGLSPYNAIFLEVACAFIAVLLSLLLGKLLMGRFYGLIFAALICTNIYFNINMRTGTSFIVLTTPLVLATVYFFLKAHYVKTNGATAKWIFLLFSGVFLALCYFNGYPISYPAGLFTVLFFLFLAIVGILVKFKVIDREYQDFRLLNIWQYLAFVMLSISLYFLFTLAWDKYNGAPYFTTYKTSLGVNMGRYSGTPADFDEVKKNAMRVFDTYFIDMDKDGHFTTGGVHSDTSLDGVAILSPILVLFFIIGILAIFKKHRQADISILIFFLATSGVLIFLFKPFAPRVFIFCAPFLLLISSLGITDTVNRFLVKTGLNKFWKGYASYGIKTVTLGATLFLIGIPAYNTVHYTFMRTMDGNKLWYARQADLYNFLKNEGVDNKDLVILAGSQDMYVWLEPIIINRRKINTVPYNNIDSSIGNFGDWLLAQLRDYRRIYFIFPSEYYHIKKPGLNYSQFGMKTAYSSFLDENPNIQPIKTIYDAADIPMHYIYRLDKDTLSFRHLEIKIHSDDELKIIASHQNYVKCLSVSGPVKAIVFKNGADAQRIPLETTKNMEMYLDFSNEGIAEFYPNFDSEKDAFTNVFTTEYAGRRSIMLMEGRGGFNWLQMVPGFVDGFLVYELKFPYKVTRLDLRTNPRIFNDFFKRNSVSSYISLDNKHYKKIFEVKSNGNERFGGLSAGGGRGGDRDSKLDCAGFNEYSTYDILYPNSNKFYVNFNLHSQWSQSDAQLISHNKTMFFKTRLDTADIKRPILKNGTEILIEKGDSPVEAKIIITLQDNSGMPSKGKALIKFNEGRPFFINKTGNGNASSSASLDAEHLKDLEGKVIVFSAFVKTKNSKCAKLSITESRISDCLLPAHWILSRCELSAKDNTIKYAGQSSLKLTGSHYQPYPEAQYVWKPREGIDLSGKEILFQSYIRSEKPNIARLKIMEVYSGGKFIPTGWVLGGNSTVFKEKDKKFDGKYSAKISGAAGGEGNMNIFIREGIEKAQGRQVTFSLNVLSNVADACQLRLSEYTDDDVKVGENFSNFYSGSKEWETIKVSRQLNKNAKGIQLVIINRTVSPDSFVLVDGAKLIIKGKSEDMEMPVKNGGFEEWIIKSTPEQNGAVSEVSENYSGFHPGNGEWLPLIISHTLENTPKEVRISILNQGGQGDSINVDDVKLVITDKGQENTVENAGFEEWTRVPDYEYKSEISSDFHSGSNNWEFLQVKKVLRPQNAPLYFDINASNITQNNYVAVDDAIVSVE